ncbi:UNVERIFIED_CONTAM: hypothetical protein Sradi_1599100 [Sesamum radiatum]|uniref:RNase H type-1 domain-containing protein n=1 Tax=Sesamum radiatum TaxID=300843 RepID=A0AAW2UAT9_SESRA
MAAMNLFRAGCRWRIGSGRLVNICQDPWLPHTHSVRVITPKPHMCQVMRVSDIIVEDLRIWDEDMITTLFWPKDRELILQIPLGIFVASDLMVWHYSNNGTFSFRSAYHLALSLDSLLSTSGNRWDRIQCRMVWQANIPNKQRIRQQGPARAGGSFCGREAMRLAQRFHWSHVILEGDCQTLINKLASTSLDFSISSSVLEDIRASASLFMSVTFSFVMRSGNSVADLLAKQALDQDGGSVSLPSGLATVILDDLSN